MKYSHHIYKTKQNKENKGRRAIIWRSQKCLFHLLKSRRKCWQNQGQAHGTGGRHGSVTLWETKDRKELRKLVLEAGSGKMRKQGGIAMGAGKHLEGIRRKLTLVFCVNRSKVILITKHKPI